MRFESSVFFLGVGDDFRGGWKNPFSRGRLNEVTTGAFVAVAFANTRAEQKKIVNNGFIRGKKTRAFRGKGVEEEKLGVYWGGGG